MLTRFHQYRGGMVVNTRGFTLIELVVVIIIIAVLSVIVVPRFIQLSSEAKRSDMQQLYGALKQNMSLIHAKATIEGKDSLESASVDNVPIAYGYPTAQGMVDSLHGAEQWYPLTFNPSDLVLGGSLLGVKTSVTMFSLDDNYLSEKSLKDKVKYIQKGQCYVTYVDIAMPPSPMEPDKPTPELGWGKRLLCGLLARLPFPLDQYIPFCPRNHDDSSSGESTNESDNTGGEASLIIDTNGC